MSPDLSGRTIGQYKLLERIGLGGMAAVYRAQQINIDRQVAVKIMRADLTDTPDFVLRFKREADAIARLEHPHVLPIYDYGEDNAFAVLSRCSYNTIDWCQTQHPIVSTVRRARNTRTTASSTSGVRTATLSSKDRDEADNAVQQDLDTRNPSFTRR